MIRPVAREESVLTEPGACHMVPADGGGIGCHQYRLSIRGRCIIRHMSLLQNYKNAVTPAEAGVQKPLTSLDSCFRRNDRKKQV
jgi:hypothetical protein